MKNGKISRRSRLIAVVEQFLAGLERARQLGCRQILYWEADYIDNNSKKAELQKVMRENAAMPAKR